MIRLGFSRQSKPSALRIAEASDGQIEAVRNGPCDVNWGRRHSTSATLNPDISASVEKYRMRQLFISNGVPTPATFFDVESAMGAADGMGLIGRPDFHTRGRHMWICKDSTGVELSTQAAGGMLAATHWIEYVDPSRATKEFRVHVFRGQSIRMSMKDHIRDATGKSILYTTQKPPEGLPKRPIREAAKAAVRAVGLDFGVVDILTSEDQLNVWVLEVNAAPGLGGSTPRLWVDTFVNHFTEGGEHHED